MKAPLPYHFCVIIGCNEMTPPGAVFCAEHCMTEFGDGFFPGAESLATASLSPDASQEQHTKQNQPVPGDAGSSKESNS